MNGAKVTGFQVLSPLSGPIVPLGRVPDPVFSGKMMGDGVAIDPTTQVVLAPFAGRIVQLHPAGHAVTIESAEGLQVLVHIGLDTVKLKGEGFSPKVQVGDRVSSGQTLIAFDADAIAQKAKSLVSVIVVIQPTTNRITLAPGSSAKAGKLLMTVDFQEADKIPETPSKPGEKAESKPVEVKLATGLHARPAALITSMAKRFQSRVELKKGSKSSDAKSVVGLLSLEVANGDYVKFFAEGPDAKTAVHDLAEFLKTLKEQPEVQAVTSAPKRTSVDPNLILGVGASPGVAIGRIHQVQAERFEFREQAARSSADEKSLLTKALQTAAFELDELLVKLSTKTDAAKAAIFTAHLELLEDPALIETATQQIEAGKSAAYAWNSAVQTQAERLAQLNNELMANRANDLRDVGRRVLRHLAGGAVAPAAQLKEDSILIAETLTPSETVQLDRSRVLGFCTTTGGATSHVAILARSLGIPAVAGVDAKALGVLEGTEAVLDGDRGELRLNPSAAEKQRAVDQQLEQQRRRTDAIAMAMKPAKTKDGRTIEVAANIGGVEDARRAVELGCDGVGLLRSEFLFLDRESAPSEDEQYRVYQDIADVLGDRPLIIRTLDVGGDKPLKYLPIPHEENPFLGVRGIRVGFLRPEILREQFRAILRVRSKGKLSVMLPMISTVDEFRKAKKIFEEERLKVKGKPAALGIMVEVPSAALLADAFAAECDFFSIGTNDLTQYTLAMDRGHKDLAGQVDGLHPSVLKLIEMTVGAAKRHGKWVGVCGGIAGDAKAVPVLLGLGVDELSVSVPAIPLVKSQVRSTDINEAKVLAAKALKALGAIEVRGMSL